MRSESKELNIFTTYAPVKHTLHKGKHSLISFLNGIKNLSYYRTAIVTQKEASTQKQQHPSLKQAINTKY